MPNRPLLLSFVALALAGCPTNPVVSTDAGADAPSPGDAPLPRDTGTDAPGMSDTPVFSDTPVETDTGVIDPDTGVGLDAGTDAPPSVDGGPPPLPAITDPSAHAVPASANGADRLFGVVMAPDSSFYVAGQAADARVCVGGPTPGTPCTADAACGTGGTCPVEDFRTIVGHFTAAGDLDTSFGSGGWFQQNLVVGTNGEVGRGIDLQDDGRIVVSATVEHAGATDARDRDVAVFRLEPDGTLDDTFATAGIGIYDLSAGEAVPAPGTGYAADTSWNLEIDASGRIVVAVGLKRPGGTDVDWGIMRLTSSGALDTSFAGDGVYQLDISNLGASIRDAHVLPSGDIAGAGYYSEASIVRPVIYLVDDLGAPVTTFGTGGLYTEVILTRQVEVYGAVLQNGTDFVTAGYGGETATTNDFISLRIDATTGVRDLSYAASQARACVGGPTVGMACTADAECGTGGTCRPPPGVAQMRGFDLGDNARAAIVMPDGGVALLGRIATPLSPRVCVGGTAAGTACTMDSECAGGGCPSSRFEAAIWLLTEDGDPDAAFGTNGVELHDIAGGATTNNGDPDQFHGAAVDPRGERVVFVGTTGTNPVGDDDALVYLMPVP